MAKKKTPPKKKWAEMTKEELAAATADYDREMLDVLDQTREPTPAERARLKGLRKRGRPIEGQGAQRVAVTIERSLLKKADKLAKRLKISRAKLIARGLEKMLTSGK